MNSAVIVAGGLGTRFGGDVPKQFIQLDGQEILSFSVQTFLNHPQIDEVIIVSHPDWLDQVVSKYPGCKIAVGGNRRQDSSTNGVKAVSSESINILIHDAARPFVSNKIISNCILALETHECVAPIIPSSDSLVKWDGKEVGFVDRTKIQIVQTPQCFNKKIITEILKSNISGTDEIGMLLKLYPRSKVKFIQGSLDNVKITTQNDLNYFSNAVI